MNKPECAIGQGFGENVNDIYKPLLGHPAIDNSCGYGTPIHAYFDGYVYKVLTRENPANDGSGFTGVFTLCEQGGKVFEFLYGHCNPSVKVGDTVKKGDVIGTEGNNGDVFSGHVRITLDMQKAGDHRGAHRHDQARLLRKDASVLPDTTYLTGPGGSMYQKDGFYYAIPDYRNGYNGCFDWTLPGAVSDQPSPFLKMQQAIFDFQLSEGLVDFKGKPLKDVRFGPKTLSKALKYYK